jgi:hypothetical protein
MGDLQITDEDLPGDILARRKRHLSCGDNYHVAFDGERLSQVGIFQVIYAGIITSTSGKGGECLRKGRSERDSHASPA